MVASLPRSFGEEREQPRMHQPGAGQVLYGFEGDWSTGV